MEKRRTRVKWRRPCPNVLIVVSFFSFFIQFPSWCATEEKKRKGRRTSERAKQDVTRIGFQNRRARRIGDERGSLEGRTLRVSIGWWRTWCGWNCWNWEERGEASDRRGAFDERCSWILHEGCVGRCWNVKRERAVYIDWERGGN